MDRVLYFKRLVLTSPIQWEKPAPRKNRKQIQVSLQVGA